MISKNLQEITIRSLAIFRNGNFVAVANLLFSLCLQSAATIFAVTSLLFHRSRGEVVQLQWQQTIGSQLTVNYEKSVLFPALFRGGNKSVNYLLEYSLDLVNPWQGVPGLQRRTE